MTLPKLLLLLFAAHLGYAQAPTPTFEVATIKPAATSSDGHTHINYPPNGRFSATNITLFSLMQWDYGIPEKQILDGPACPSSPGFDTQAEADIGDRMKSLTS